MSTRRLIFSYLEYFASIRVSRDRNEISRPNNEESSRGSQGFVFRKIEEECIAI